MADLGEPDEFRPAKRARMDAPLEITEAVQDEIVDDEDWDDVYDDLDGASDPRPAGSGKSQVVYSAVNGDAREAYPGNEAGVTLEPAAALNVEHTKTSHAEVEEQETKHETYDGVPAEAIDEGDELVTEQSHTADTDDPSARMLEQTSEVQYGPPKTDQGLEKTDTIAPSCPSDDVRKDQGADVGSAAVQPRVNGGGVEASGRDAEQQSNSTQDPEFMAAAAVQKQNENAEWQFDSSDAASSSDSDSDSSSDESSDGADSDSEDGYEMLDPATAAKILMSGDGDDDDGDKKNKTGDRQPRTANEVKEEVVPKPSVVVTEDMKITLLGMVDRTVENMVLIKAVTPGEYRVLESGSVLCTETRQVIGAVAETLGRVQEPMYSVAFTNAAEIADAGLEFGTNVFYVDSHSTFVFTQPLKNLKGTDASNIHDEEAGDDEIEFSDDEVEAEYKRQKKLAKRGGRGGLRRGDFEADRAARSFGAPAYDGGQGFVNGSDAPQQAPPSSLSYDEGDVQEEFYQPLRRPDNLTELMSGASPPRPQFFDRGRGRGRGDRGRGRGDRGRGRGGHDHRSQRGGRGGHAHDGGRGGRGHANGYRGNARSFPDHHNSGRPAGRREHALPPRPDAPQGSSSPPAPQHRSGHEQYPAAPYSGSPHASYQQQQQPASSPQASTYQFNGQSYQYGNVPPPPSRQAPPPPSQAPQYGYYDHPGYPYSSSSTDPIPAGAYVNPVFFHSAGGQERRQQPVAGQYQQSPPQHQYPQTPTQHPQQAPPPGYCGWGGQQAAPQQQQASVYGGVQSQSTAAAATPDLAEILRKLGGQQ